MADLVFLSKYRVIRPLDEGGMSRIYLARATDTNQEVVVKVLKAPFRAQRQFIELFRREIHILTRFQHPHAVAALDCSTISAHGPVLVMEYLRGMDLGQLIQQRARFSPDRVGRLLAQLCAVLQAAHDAGFVHGDVKPGNCMILHPGTPQETLKLMDFGLARMRSMLYIAPEEIHDPSIPAASGTPEYICPEQVLGQEMDHRADLYSVGVVLFELLTGQRPFSGQTPQELMRAHAVQPPPRCAIQGVERALSSQLEAVIHNCLAKHPDGRPGSATAVVEQYEKALGRKLLGERHSGVIPGLTAKGAGAPAVTGRPTAPAAPDRAAVQHRVEAVMPEALAIVKVKGFIHDLGGEIVESVPGLIKVKLPDPQARQKKGGVLGWFGGGGGKPVAVLQAIGATDLELHMERKDPAQPSRLTVTVIMRPAGRGPITPEWRKRCDQIGRDMQAYLMGR